MYVGEAISHSFTGKVASLMLATGCEELAGWLVDRQGRGRRLHSYTVDMVFQLLDCPVKSGGLLEVKHYVSDVASVNGRRRDPHGVDEDPDEGVKGAGYPRRNVLFCSRIPLSPCSRSSLH